MNDTITRHPKTGLPVRDVPQLKVGDLVSECYGASSYPAVVVEATASTVYVRALQAGMDYLLSVSKNDVPGYNGYGDSSTLVIAPGALERVLCHGTEGPRAGAKKYVRRVPIHPTAGSLADQERFGGEHHLARWSRPGERSGGLTVGAHHRRDPHI